MEDATKKRIASLVKATIDSKKMSARAWSDSVRISPATISQVLAGKWDLIADKMWRKVGASVNYQGSEWKAAQTRDFRDLTTLLGVAQSDGITIGVADDAGRGKTFAMQHYANNNGEVYYIQCADFWTKKFFLETMYRTLGMEPEVLTSVQLASSIINELRKRNKPLVIIDEVDKLRDTTLMFFIELYNKLDGVCGFFLAGAPFLRKQIERGAQRDKRGYREILSRVGRRFISLKGANEKDVAAICMANGVSAADDIHAIWNEVEREKDLRRVKREIDKRSAQLRHAA